MVDARLGKSVLALVTVLTVLLLSLTRCASYREAVGTSLEGGPWAIEVGPEGEYVYWLRSHSLDADEQQVYRTAVSSGETERIIEGKEVLDIALDEKRERLYWSLEQGLIKRGRLDGSGAVTVTDQLPHPTRIALDESSGTLYWMTTPEPASYYRSELVQDRPERKDHGLVRKAEIDRSTSSEESILEGDARTVLRLNSPINRFNLLGWFALEPDTSTGTVLYGDLEYTETSSVYYTSRAGQGDGSRVFEWGRISGRDLGNYDVAPRMGFATHSARDVFYHNTDDGRIVEVTYGENQLTQTVLSSENAPPTDIAVGPDGEKIYWTQYTPEGGSASGVFRSDLDGSDRERIVTDSVAARISAAGGTGN